MSLLVLHFRFRVFLFGLRVCDKIGRPLDALMRRVPFLAERIGACTLLHGIVFRGNVPDEWW